MLKDLINTAGQRLLEQDPQNHDKLEKLAGKAIAFEIKKLDKTLYFSPTTEALNVGLQAPEIIDVTIRAKPSTLLKISRDGIDNAELSSGELEIDGDAITGQRFAKLLSELDIDWEELFAQQIGDVSARLLFDGLQRLRSWGQETQSTVKQNISEFLVEEAKLAASKTAIDTYLDDVDALRNDVARLAARIRQLRAIQT
ncbi:MAG: ubiquinone biosynthesis accessory factor UbiJ [Arenicella sp.]